MKPLIQAARGFEVGIPIGSNAYWFASEGANDLARPPMAADPSARRSCCVDKSVTAGVVIPMTLAITVRPSIATTG
jgi:hypothetical protein